MHFEGESDQQTAEGIRDVRGLEEGSAYSQNPPPPLELMENYSRLLRFYRIEVLSVGKGPKSAFSFVL